MTEPEAPRYQVAAKRIGSVTAFVVVNMALQIVAQMMIAYHFGAAQETDAYFMARDIADLFGKFFLTGQITVVLMPLFIEFQSQRSQEEGFELLRQVMNMIVMGVGGLLVLVGIGAPFLVRLLAPGFEPGTRELTVGLFRILLLSTFLTLLVSVAAALLNAVQRFTLPRAAAGLLPLGLIVALVAFKRWGGVSLLAWGLVAGNAAQAAVLFAAARREGLSWRPGFAPWRSEGVRRLLWLMAPFLAAYAASTAQGAIFKIIVSYFPAGSFSTLSYAGRLMKALFAVTVTAFNVVIFHTIARQAVGGKMEALAETTMKSLRMTLFIMLPITAIGIALSTPLIKLLLEHGSFTRSATAQTSWLLVIYLLSMPFLACSTLLTNVLYSLQETHTTVKIGVTASLFIAVIYWPLAKLLGLSGLVWASVCSSVFLGVAGYRVVVSRVAPLKGRRWSSFLRNVSLAVVAAWGATAASVMVVGWAFSRVTLVGQLTAVLLPSLIGVAAFSLVASAIGLEEAGHFWRIVTGMLKPEALSTPSGISVPKAKSHTLSGEN